MNEYPFISKLEELSQTLKRDSRDDLAEIVSNCISDFRSFEEVSKNAYMRTFKAADYLENIAKPLKGDKPELRTLKQKINFAIGILKPNG